MPNRFQMNFEKNIHLKNDFKCKKKKKLIESKREEEKYIFQMTADWDKRKWILGWADRWTWPGCDGWSTDVAWTGWTWSVDKVSFKLPVTDLYLYVFQMKWVKWKKKKQKTDLRGMKWTQIWKKEKKRKKNTEMSNEMGEMEKTRKQIWKEPTGMATHLPGWQTIAGDFWNFNRQRCGADLRKRKSCAASSRSSLCWLCREAAKEDKLRKRRRRPA